MEMSIQNKKDANKMYLSSGIVSICGIIYQVLFGGVGSYLLGNGILAYCLSIGLSLSGMGFGSLYSEKIKKNLLNQFIGIEYIIGFFGGFSVFFLFYSMAVFGTDATPVILCLLIFITGVLTGVELPVLIRKANEKGEGLGRSAALVLFSDYSGSLLGTLLFALYLQPKLGFIKTGFLVAMINVLVAIWLTFTFEKELKHVKLFKAIGVFLFVVLFLGFLLGEKYANGFEQKLYDDPIVYMDQTKYQKLVATKAPGDVRLYQNGQLQFAESDEHRYHESLVHPVVSLAMQRTQKPLNVLIFGGGDGLAMRELLKYENRIEKVTMVDLDPEMIKFARENAHMKRLNEGSLESDKLEVINKDAFNFIQKDKQLYDVIIIDLPDPDNEGLNKLYTKEFYSLVRNHLAANGLTVAQSTSPLFAREAYWTISKTMESTDMFVDNYHVDIPSFGNWGFVMASREKFEPKQISVQVETKYLSNEMIEGLFSFGKDEDENIMKKNGKPFEYKINTLNKPVLHDLYNKAWQFY